MDNKINDILNVKKKVLPSNIVPIARMGVPVRNKYGQMAEFIKEPTSDIGYVKGGDIATGLASGLKSALAFYGASKDALAQQAYNDNQAQLAEQERQDKLAQQAAEQDLKERELAQKKELAQIALEAEQARAKLAREQALQDMATKRAQAVEDWNAQKQAAIEAENRKRAYEEEQLAIKQLDPASQQKYYEMKQQGQTPVIIDNKVGWVGKILGKPKYKISVSEILKKGNNYSASEADIMSKGL